MRLDLRRERDIAKEWAYSMLMCGENFGVVRYVYCGTINTCDLVSTPSEPAAIEPDVLVNMEALKRIRTELIAPVSARSSSIRAIRSLVVVELSSSPKSRGMIPKR